MARVLFLQRIWTENLGPMYLSSMARRQGHEVGLLIEDRSTDISGIRAFAPDLIAFSVTTGTHPWALQRARAIREQLDCPIIIGGPHATYFPEVIEDDAVDFACRGEGERAFCRLLDALDQKTPPDAIPNLWVKSNQTLIRNDVGDLIEDLDSLPFPDRDLYYRYRYLRDNENKSFMTSRGCPYCCAYCSINTLRQIYQGKGTFVRFHSPERVIAEITEVRDRYGLRSVIFQDDTFILNTDRLMRLLELYARKLRIPFVCHVRADLMTADIARALKEAGCHSVDFGLESGDQKLRSDVLGKTVTDDHIIKAADCLHAEGIRFRTTNMLGLPHETLEQALSTVLLNQRIRTDFPSASIYQPYPRTDLGDRVIAEGLAGHNYSVNRIGSSFFRASTLDQPHRDAFINLQKLFWLAVRFPALLPLIRRLIRVKPNKLFELVFLFFYGVNYALSERVRFRRVFQIGLKMARTVFFGKM